MPIISFASPKGGVGKSTSALILATELAHRDVEVSIVDADPNAVLAEWAAREAVPNITVHGHVTEKGIVDLIFDEADRVPFVIVDLEGTANLKMGRAVANSDFVVVPMGCSHVDALRAIEAVALIKTEARTTRRPIPFAALLTRASPITVTREEKAARIGLEGEGIPIFDTKIIDRAAYRSLFAYGGDLYGLPRGEVGGLDNAIANGAAFADELLARLKGEGAP